MAAAYVYVISAGTEAVKIGVARDPNNRLKSLQTGHFKKLSVAYEIAFAGRDEAYAVECRVHRLLKAQLMEGEWFAVSPEEAKEAVERVISDIQEARIRKEEMLKASRYVPPEVIQAAPGMRDPIDAVHHAAKRDGEMKTEYLVDFGDCIVFVHCGKNRKTGERVFMTNDVTHWYIGKGCAAQMETTDGEPQ
jgi:hypothetical protein